MDKFIVKGPSKLKGEIAISGSKNAALPILASTILFEKEVVIKNLPRVKDIDTMINLLKSLGSIIKFSKDKLVPIIIQEYSTSQVLMLAWMNKESLKQTFKSGFMTYWSRSRNCLWKKGETSGNFQKLKSIHQQSHPRG